MNNSVAALVGGAIGDAAGAFLEFRGDNINIGDVQEALTLPGGGSLNIGAAQVTDDTELTLALAQALLAPSDLPLDTIAAAYCKWRLSCPFDCGMTCSRAFSFKPTELNLSVRMQEHVQNCNAASKANEAMMRCCPIAIRHHCKPDSVIAEYARLDAQLSHPNQTCQDCNAVHCIALAHLIRRPGEAEGAIVSAERWAAEHACEEVQQWLKESAVVPATLGPFTTNIEFVKWAFLLAFSHLRAQSGFMEALTHVLACKGDTDTNAKIVLELVSCYHGMSGVPEALAYKVLTYQHVEGDLHGYLRPDWLSPSHILRLARQLYQADE
jgi:ADP-ribosyl-[dinitrogen reductase] hydrolase